MRGGLGDPVLDGASLRLPGLSCALLPAAVLPAVLLSCCSVHGQYRGKKIGELGEEERTGKERKRKNGKNKTFIFLRNGLTAINQSSHTFEHIQGYFDSLDKHLLAGFLAGRGGLHR